MLAWLTDPFASPIVQRALVELLILSLACGPLGVAVCVSALLGLGAMLALSPASPPRLQELLFGDLLGVSGGDLAVAGALAGAVALALAAGHRSLALVGFDRRS